MTDKQKAYAIAVQLYTELQVHEDHCPELKHSISLADQLAREMGWIWVSE